MSAVTIVGPNLRDQSRGQFHVHRAGCRDLDRYSRVEQSGAWTTEVDSRLEVARAVYDFVEDPRDALDEFHFLPCVAYLPLEVPA